MTTTTMSYLVERWNGDGDPDEWPYPTKYSRYRIEGRLAERIRERTGLDGEVSIVEKIESGGYSEWTQEDEYLFDVWIGTTKVWTAGTLGYYDDYSPAPDKTTFASLSVWLQDIPA